MEKVAFLLVDLLDIDDLRCLVQTTRVLHQTLQAALNEKPVDFIFGFRWWAIKSHFKPDYIYNVPQNMQERMHVAKLFKTNHWCQLRVDEEPGALHHTFYDKTLTASAESFASVRFLFRHCVRCHCYDHLDSYSIDYSYRLQEELELCTAFPNVAWLSNAELFKRRCHYVYSKIPTHPAKPRYIPMGGGLKWPKFEDPLLAKRIQELQGHVTRAWKQDCPLCPQKLARKDSGKDPKGNDSKAANPKSISVVLTLSGPPDPVEDNQTEWVQVSHRRRRGINK
jgi:hypothetical protein